MEEIKYNVNLITFVESFIEIKMITENKIFTVLEIFYELKKLWPNANIDNFRKAIRNSLNIKISNDDIISIEKSIKDPWD
jgi:hypothetical protein